MNVQMLYRELENHIPKELSCEWDNDGIMLAFDANKDIRRVAVALDANAISIENALAIKADLIITHHPLIFHPARHLSFADPMQKSLAALAKNGVALFSFHTRLDAVQGGVNDILAKKLGLTDCLPACEVGRGGYLKEPVDSSLFAATVKEKLGSDRMAAVLPNPVSHHVALLGGSGKHCLEELVAEGFDTFVTGEVSFDEENAFYDAGINLICAGHYFTEFPVCQYIKQLLLDADPTLEVAVIESNVISGGLH